MFECALGSLRGCCLALLLMCVVGMAACRDPHIEAPATRTHPIRSTPGGVDLLMYGGDLAHTSWNRRETALTPDNVRPETFGLIATADNVYDIEGAPLFASAIPVIDERAGGREVRADVVFVATVRNEVFAVDADNLGIMWRFNFEGRRAAWADELQSCQGRYPIGVFSTPVLSPDRSLLYVVGRVATGSTIRDTWLQGYALRTRDGSIAARFRVGETLGADGVTRTPLSIDTTERGRALRLSFMTHQYTQRSALLLVNDMLYVSTGGICDTPGFRGWLMAFDVTRLSEQTGPRAVYVPTPGGGGGMWAAGGAVSDGRSIYVAIGNGRADMRADTPPSMRSNADSLVRLGPDLSFDARACFNIASPTAACGPGDTANLRNVFMPRNAELLARESIPDPMALDGDISDPDEDFGSSGPLLVPPALLPENMGVDDGRNLVALGGKDGFFFLVDRDRMGGVGPSPLRVEDDIANLVGSELDGRELFLHSTSGGIRGNAAYFEGRSGRYLYVIGADEITGRIDSPRGLAAVRLTRVSDPTPAACGEQFRRIAYHGATLPCATIWGARSRPGFELAWSGTAPTLGTAPFVSSNGHSQGIVWVTYHRPGAEGGLLQAFSAEAGAGTGRVVAPIYTSDRVAADRVEYVSAFVGPVVANGRVYVAGNTLMAFGLIPRRTLPPVVEPTVPDCPTGVSWEREGRSLMTRYCTSCHDEYQDLRFIQQRHSRVAVSVLPPDGSRPSMPLQRPGRMVPEPTAAERAQLAAWLRCGAPSATTRLHAGHADVMAPEGMFVGDDRAVDPNRPGVLSDDRLAGAPIANRYAPAVPDALFAVDRTGPTRYRIVVPGQGRYAVTAYFAENSCAPGVICRNPFDVALAGRPWLTSFDITSAAGSTRRVIARRAAVDLPVTSRLMLDVGERGKLHAIEVVRVERCTTSTECPRGFACVGNMCSAEPDDAPADAGAPMFDADVAPRDAPVDMGVAVRDVPVDMGVAVRDVPVDMGVAVRDAPADRSLVVADRSAPVDSAAPPRDVALESGVILLPSGGGRPPQRPASRCSASPQRSTQRVPYVLGVVFVLMALRRRTRGI